MLFVKEFQPYMAERTDMIRKSVLAFAREVFFSHIDIITSHNDRLVLRVYIDVNGNDAYDDMIIYEGKYHFHEGVLKKIKMNQFFKETERLCNRCQEDIIKAANSWCKDLGLPELTEEC